MLGVTQARSNGKKTLLDFHLFRARGSKSENFPHAVFLVLTAIAQMLNDSQCSGDDLTIFGVQSVLDGNYDLRNNRQDLLAVSVQHIVNGIAGDHVVRKIRFT